jgi:hypothetical protein
MRKEIISILLLLTALFPLSVLTSPSTATPTTSLSVKPQVLTGLEIGVSFTINITVTNVTDLYGWQFSLYYNPSILNATGKSEGPFLKQDGASTFYYIVDFTDNYNATHGKITLTSTRLQPAEKGVNGTGTLATITFKTLAYGNSPLDLADTKLSDSTEPFPNLIPHEVQHGRVHVGLIDIAIINVAAPLNVPKGNLALINVTVENQGIITETFDVTVNYDATTIGTQTVTNLTATEIRTLTFPWDTTPIPIGEYLLTATATIIPGETDLEDNTYNAGLIYVGRRDIAITNTHPSKTFTNDTIVYINVTVTNKGETTAIFNLTAHRDTNPIETKTNINLAPGATVSLIFTLDTTPLPKGIYTISTTATTLPGETNTADNTFIDGTITETILGDVTGDFKVDILDIATIARAYGAYPGHPRWNPNADLDNNNKIDIIDIAKAAKNYGKEI